MLYSHFAGKSAIGSAVAEQGFADLATALGQACAGVTDSAERLARAARAYLDFAATNPALYDAMFSMSTDLTFGPEAAQPLRDAFGELEALFRPLVDEADLGARAEVAWSALHGLATLERGGRLRPELRDRRLALLVAEWLAAIGGSPA
ncbi:TetR-like C-terminal domain-containing protein [Nocardia sp. NPDC049190]|uniref:TetR-like C-terminal domain-containing protein n=1 Tax=Nocardia sp. NPDC049190 TaxID=3155650 RepID=UPI0033D7D859